MNFQYFFFWLNSNLRFLIVLKMKVRAESNNIFFQDEQISYRPDTMDMVAYEYVEDVVATGFSP